jgi:hypothetical protein
MDEGTFHKKYKVLILCTDNYSHYDVYRFMNVLQIKFNLNCRIERKKTQLRIVIKAKSMEILRFLVKDHIHPSMLYKLGLHKNKLLVIQPPATKKHY